MIVSSIYIVNFKGCLTIQVFNTKEMLGIVKLFRVREPVEGVRLNLGAMILGSNYIIKDVNSIIKLLFVILGTIFITFDFQQA